MNPVSHPPHYANNTRAGVECIEIAQWLSFNVGNAFKYVWRHRDKGNVKLDLEKAMQYLEFEQARRDELAKIVRPQILTPRPYVPSYVYRKLDLIYCDDSQDFRVSRLLCNIARLDIGAEEGHVIHIMRELDNYSRQVTV